jgi:hypothetical protein
MGRMTGAEKKATDRVVIAALHDTAWIGGGLHEIQHQCPGRCRTWTLVSVRIGLEARSEKP